MGHESRACSRDLSSPRNNNFRENITSHFPRLLAPGAVFSASGDDTVDAARFLPVSANDAVPSFPTLYLIGYERCFMRRVKKQKKKLIKRSYAKHTNQAYVGQVSRPRPL